MARAPFFLFSLTSYMLSLVVDRDHGKVLVDNGLASSKPLYMGRCASGDTRSGGWDSEHRQRCRAKRIT